MKTSKIAKRKAGHGNGRLIVMIALVSLGISSIVIVPVAVYKNTEMSSSGGVLPPTPTVQPATGETPNASASTQRIATPSDQEQQVDELGKDREKSDVKSVGAGRVYTSSYVRVKFNDPPPRPQSHVDPPFTGGDKGDKPLW